MKPFEVSVLTSDHLKAVLNHTKTIRCIYVPFELLKRGGNTACLLAKIKEAGTRLYVALPYMTREEEGSVDFEDLLEVCQLALHEQKEKSSSVNRTDPSVEGALVRNMEQLAFLAEQNFQGDMVLDSQIYIWNAAALKELLADELIAKKMRGYTLPLEQNVHEWKDTVCATDDTVQPFIIIYGRIPMMISAGCVQQTMKGCSGHKGKFETIHIEMEDRTGRKLPVECSCRYCYNVIRNAYPISLHQAFFSGKLPEQASCRLDFTTETQVEVNDILAFFGKESENSQPPYESYTTGRFQKGVD